MDERINGLARACGAALLLRRWRLTTVESCTGGWVAKSLTDIAGSSDWFECGLVTYSNAAKFRLAGVPAGLIEAHGAVSAPVAAAMAEGGLEHSAAQLAVSITGIAGPGGGSTEKPVGTVWFGVVVRTAGQAGTQVRSEQRFFSGDRRAVRAQSVCRALELVLEAAKAG